VRIPYGGASWEFGWWSGPVDLDDAIEFSDRRSALLFLLPFKSDAQFMWGLRYLLAEWNQGYALSLLGDQEVLEEIAWLLASRELWVKRKYDAVGAASATQAAATQPQPVPLPPPPPKSSAPPEPEPEEAVFLPNIDAAAMAAVLQEAAQSGKPFCEE
jgi:hypothetical protein